MEKTYKIELTEEQVNSVMHALAERPLKEVLSTFQRIMMQCEDQNSQQPMPEAVPEETPEL